MIKLRSGKEIDANHDLISINNKNSQFSNYGGWELGDGYDSSLDLLEWDDKKNDYVPEYTREELVELCEIMQARWERFKQEVIGGLIPAKA